MLKLLISSTLLLLSIQKTLSVTDGQLDPHFGNEGIVVSSFGTAIERADAIMPQLDGSLLAAGCVNCDASSLFVAAHYFANGTLDTSFNKQGWITGAALPLNGKSDAKAIGLQNSKIILAGHFYDSSNFGKFLFVRLNSDGTLDRTFPIHVGGGYAVISRADPVSFGGCIIQPDLKILATGFLSTRGRTGATIIRLTPDGVLDKSFNTSGVLDIYPTDFKITGIRDIALQADGSITIIGSAEILPRKFFVVIRCTKDGVLKAPMILERETLLGQFGGSSNDGYAVQMQNDGKMLIAGTTALDNAPKTTAVGRINKSNNFDPSFYVPGQSPFPGVVKARFSDASISIADDLFVQQDGKILALCNSPSSIGIVRYWPNGTIDTSFNPQGSQPGTVTFNGFAKRGSLEKDRNLVIALSYIRAKAQFALARYIANSTMSR